MYCVYMKPRIAVCNIFGQDADRLLDFATLNGFEGIDWSLDKDQSEKAFVAQMKKLSSFEVRFHCAFPETDFAYADSRSDTSMELLTRTIERIALVGGSHMTVHTGFGHVPANEIVLEKAMRNLTFLVERGEHCGVCVSLENLSSHWTSDPELFTELISHSGAGITLDIGHIHASSSPDEVGTTCEHYVLPNKNRIINAHIYHTELDGSGHLTPGGLEDIYDRLELLRRAESCSWWVIELKQTSDILYTRSILDYYCNASFPPSFSDRDVLKTPPADLLRG